VLRNNLKLFAAKFGCRLGQCLASAVIVDGEVVPSYVTPVQAFVDRRITTLEGIGSPERSIQCNWDSRRNRPGHAALAFRE
jgi:aerobic-type carbon monoxide dehydrogenase small subunit (CoxS/CutS family)